MKTSLNLSREEKRSWFFHQKIGRQLTREEYLEIKPLLLKRLKLMQSDRGDNLRQASIALWSKYIKEDDFEMIRKTLINVDDRSIQMRRVSPFLDLDV